MTVQGDPSDASPGSRGGGSEPGGGEGLPRRFRIRRGEEIRTLLRRGRRHRTGHLEVIVGSAEGTWPRFGTIVPRFGRSIVERNRLRRRLREIGRREVLPALRSAGSQVDVLIRVRPQAYNAAFQTLRSEILSITEGLCSDISPLG